MRSREKVLASLEEAVKIYEVVKKLEPGKIFRITMFLLGTLYNEHLVTPYRFTKTATRFKLLAGKNESDESFPNHILSYRNDNLIQMPISEVNKKDLALFMGWPVLTEYFEKLMKEN